MQIQTTDVASSLTNHQHPWRHGAPRYSHNRYHKCYATDELLQPRFVERIRHSEHGWLQTSVSSQRRLSTLIQLSCDWPPTVLLTVQVRYWRWRLQATAAGTCRWYLNTSLPTEARGCIIARRPAQITGTRRRSYMWKVVSVYLLTAGRSRHGNAVPVTSSWPIAGWQVRSFLRPLLGDVQPLAFQRRSLRWLEWRYRSMSRATQG